MDAGAGAGHRSAMVPALRLILADPALRIASAAMLLFGALIASLAPYQSLIALQVFGLTPRAYAALLVAAAAVSVIGAVGAGLLTDRTAARRAVAAGSAALLVAGFGLVLLLPGPVSFAIAHILLLPVGGSVMGQLFALARHAAAPLPGAERDTVLAAIRALFAVPFVAVLPIWALAFEAGAGLLTIYALGLPLGGLLVALIWAGWPLRGAAADREAPSGQSLPEALGELAAPEVLLRVVLTGTILGGVFMYMIVLGPAFDAEPRRSLGDVALFAALIAGLEVPVMLSVGHLVRWLGRLRCIALGAAIYAGFLCAFPLAVGSPAVWCLVVPAAVGGGIVLSLPLSYVQDLMGARTGAGGALLAVQKVAGDAAAAALFALAALLGGPSLAAVLAGAAMLTAALLLLRLDRRAPRLAV